MLNFQEQFKKVSESQKTYCMQMISHFDLSKVTEKEKLFFLWLASQNKMSPKKIISLFKKIDEDEKGFILWAMNQEEEKRKQLLSLLNMATVS